MVISFSSAGNCVCNSLAFETNYHVDDVMETLKEILDPNGVDFSLESRVQTAPRSACDCFVICLTGQPACTRQELSWPRMQEDQAVVFENLRKI